MNKIRAILARPVPRKQQTVGGIALLILVKTALGLAQDGARYKREIQPLKERIEQLEAEQTTMVIGLVERGIVSPHAVKRAR